MVRTREYFNSARVCSGVGGTVGIPRQEVQFIDEVVGECDVTEPAKRSESSSSFMSHTAPFATTSAIYLLLLSPQLLNQLGHNVRYACLLVH
jgi:hypothetical protein